ncbi:TauD/TfdA dioxygenase family protein [Vibrio ostreicida]|uniref:TauD/TfdA dioxygenase family protein n=1 Tax=Vibrio ostreicida TaxID=526588 RepID=UPI0009708C87|nr:TauD/TfdA family dioxygenase [Vibrio ostreicida]
MNITVLSAHIGALVEGIDLATLTSSQFDVLYQAYIKHKVLFFHHQNLTPQQHIALAQRFGELEPVHPFFPHLDDHNQVVVIETSPGHPPSTSYWHTDLTWQQVPCRCSILQAQYCPPKGGDTIWTSMSAVWDGLSREQQSELANLTATHGLHAFEGSRYDSIDAQGGSHVAQISQHYPPVVHPLVVRHPDSGQPSVFVNEQFTRYINEVSSQRSQAVLDDVFGRARREEYQVRFTWQPGSVAIWDNLCTQHFAVTDYGDEPRRLHRVTVRGTPLNSL